MDVHKATPEAHDLGLDAEYEILAELGRGGVSVVYLARDRVLGREVAIKVIREAHLEDDEAITRLEREARVLASLQHPNIVTLFAAKRLPAGSLALVMQHGNWRTLKSALREESPLSLAQVEGVLRDVGSALLYLHEHGMVHRDVKPENIFLERETGRALLSDFGIAKYHDGQTSVTLTGVVIGTPAYMSPEQIDGAELDGRSDLYALGMVGYEMVTGRRPWEGESLYSVIFKQKNERLPPLQSLRSDLPENFCAAIERAVEKRPEDRWADVEGFLARLSDAGSETLPPPPAPPSLGEEAAGPSHESLMARVHMVVEETEFAEPVQPARPRRLALTALGIGVLATGGVAALALASSRDEPYSPPPPSLALERAGPPARESFPAPGRLAAGAESAGAIDGPAAIPTPAAIPASTDAAPAPPVSEPSAPAAPAVSASRASTAPASAALRTPAPTAAARPRQAAGADRQSPRAPVGDAGEASDPSPSVLGVPKQSPSTPAAETPEASNPSPSVLGVPLNASGSGGGIGVVGRNPVEPRIRTGIVRRAASPPAAGATAATPRLLNRSDIGRLLDELHPSAMKKQGIGGRVVLSLLVAENGSIIKMGIVNSSGSAPLDNAALQIAKFMRFSPAEDLSESRRVWVNIPMTFAGRSLDRREEIR